MAEQNTNIGYAFPLEKLGSDLARSSFNYQSILDGLIRWDKTNEDTVTIRIAKDSSPWFEDFSIPSKKTTLDLNAVESTVTDRVEEKAFAMESLLDLTLYGGSHIFTEAIFDGDLDVDIATDEIDLIDTTNDSLINTGDSVIFETDTGTLPSPLSSTEKYVIRSKVGSKITLFEEDGTTVVDLTATGSGDVFMRRLGIDSDGTLIANPLIDNSDPGDITAFRITVNNAGAATWELFYYALITAWESSGQYRAGNIVRHNDLLFKVLIDHKFSTGTPSLDTAHYAPLIQEWEEFKLFLKCDLVSYDGDLYIADNEINSSLNPSVDGTNYTLYAEGWESGEGYDSGRYVFYNSEPYVATEEVLNSTSPPDVDTSRWERAVILSVPVMGSFNQSAVIRWQLEVDVTKFVLKNTFTTNSTPETNIEINTTVRTKEPDSIYQKRVDTFPTSNYAFWPYDKTSMWNITQKIADTDSTRPVTKRQDYSATMVFEHVNPEAKTVNFINYDGPDLDQGLCVYLPVEVNVAGVGPSVCIATPEDGYTYDFYFRIWPNVNLTDDVTRDHIINKSQIYVYSAPSLDDVKNNTCGDPIAKFSMARTTNFYVFGENIAIPDKPVCYRATFIYSRVESKWITLDYYQLPDHVFVGPVGFIDPQNPANQDINNEVIGNINPNAQNIGYETGAFPLYQDPFSKPDLSPFKVSSLDELENFKNRII